MKDKDVEKESALGLLHSSFINTLNKLQNWARNKQLAPQSAFTNIYQRMVNEFNCVAQLVKFSVHCWIGCKDCYYKVEAFRKHRNSGQESL